MTKRGPKPEPAAIKEAKGNPSRRPIGSDPSAISSVLATKVDHPKWLKKEGLQVWKEIAPRLTQLKILSGVDRETFARYCQNFGRWLKLQKTIAAEGEYYSTDTGFARPHPAMMIVLRLEPILERAEDRFGLNPSERQRLFAQRAAKPNAGDLFDAPSVPKQDPKTPTLENTDSPVGMLN